MGVEQGIVRKSGAWYTYEGDQLGQGKENARNFLRENPDMANEIEKQIKEKLGVGPRIDVDAVLAAPAPPRPAMATATAMADRRPRPRSTDLALGWQCGSTRRNGLGSSGRKWLLIARASGSASEAERRRPSAEARTARS